MKYIYEDDQIKLLNDENNQVGRAKIPFVDDNTINILSVFIDPSLRGGGEASKLMHEVYNFAKNRNLKVIPTCPYADAWFRRNPDKVDIVTDKDFNIACEL